MKLYVDADKLQEFATKLHAKQKTIFATKNQVGSPLVASLVADMIDPDKIYVYVGSETGYINGNWYYYNGSSWVSGGVYNAAAVDTDTTLSIAGKAADAKAVGDVTGNLSTLKTTSKTNLVSAINELAHGGSGDNGAIISILINNLIPILRECVYTSDQSDSIDNLINALEALEPANPITPSFSSGTLTLSGFAAAPSWTI